MKHKIIIAALGIVLFSISTPLLAQKTKNLPLDEAIQLAVKNSGQLKIAKSRADEAMARYRESKNNRLPDVKVSAAYMRVSAPQIDLKTNSGSKTDTAKKTSTSMPNIDQLAYGMVNASLPLFSGFRIKYGVESAKFLEQAARMDAEQNKEELTELTINAYINLFKNRKSLELIEENLKQQKQRVADFTNLEKNGLMARNDLLKAQLAQSNIELALLDAQNNLTMTYINMNLLLGLPEDTELIPDNEFGSTGDAGNAITWEQTALGKRKDITALSLREKAAGSAVKSIKGEYYPGIALTGGYIAADIPNFLTITNALNVGVGLQYNLGALWKTGAKVAEAKAKLYQTQVSQNMLSDQIRTQVNKSYHDYILANQKIEVYTRATEQANENYRITKNKFDNNLVTTTDLLEADVMQLQAKLNLMFSKADAYAAYKKLQQTSGTLLEK
jgi:outer membrane protein